MTSYQRRPGRRSQATGNTRERVVVAAAVGNAIFDATGVRVREVPFTPERVKAALSGSR